MRKPKQSTEIINGNAIAVDSYGDSEERSAFYIPGLTQGKAHPLTRRICYSLEEQGYGVVTLDPPGLGESTGQYGINSTLDTAHELYERYQANQPMGATALVGYSLGGFMAVQIAKEMTQAVELAAIHTPASRQGFTGYKKIERMVSRGKLPYVDDQGKLGILMVDPTSLEEYKNKDNVADALTGVHPRSRVLWMADEADELASYPHIKKAVDTVNARPVAPSVELETINDIGHNPTCKKAIARLSIALCGWMERGGNTANDF